MHFSLFKKRISFLTLKFVKLVFNRGEEVELDVDPAVVVVLVLSDLSSNESDSHLGLRSNNRARQLRAHRPSEQHT